MFQGRKNFVLVVHGHLCLAVVTYHGVVVTVGVGHRKLQFLLRVEGAVDHEHGPVLRVVHVMPLAVQTQHGEAGRAVQPWQKRTQLGQAGGKAGAD
jgi:hypothetical protein